MGNSPSAHRPNVRERHSRALYVNVPIAKDAAAKLLAPSSRVRVDARSGSGRAWLSFVIDDLDSLEAWTGAGFLPTPLSGWMMKSNLLVEANPDGKEWLPAYQILNLDFENSLGGRIKVAGARSTQRIPSNLATFRMSDGASGKSHLLNLNEGAVYEAEVLASSGIEGGRLLAHIAGRLAPLSAEEQVFASFVASRPHKILSQDMGKAAVYAPEVGEGASFTAEGMVKVEPAVLELEGLLGRGSLHDIQPDSLDFSNAVVLLQPEYTLLDHTNAPI